MYPNLSIITRLKNFCRSPPPPLIPLSSTFYFGFFATTTSPHHLPSSAPPARCVHHLFSLLFSTTSSTYSINIILAPRYHHLVSPSSVIQAPCLACAISSHCLTPPIYIPLPSTLHFHLSTPPPRLATFHHQTHSSLHHFLIAHSYSPSHLLERHWPEATSLSSWLSSSRQPTRLTSLSLHRAHRPTMTSLPRLTRRSLRCPPLAQRRCLSSCRRRILN
ncbi:hypothetical protein IWX46DRAFT_372210 [Phyllosticta citricarpa]|uniref:Uncharacterized protein n=1 Tax=Phyllosticta citricarpa TaxID=55181 RepID=A0ABR1L7M3_9PEZI